MTNSLDAFFFPKSVAIIGASSDPNKLSHGILKNITSYGYKGNVIPVNPNNTEILGHKCYRTIEEVDKPIDLAVIILPAQMIADVLNACGKLGIKAAIVISGGFKEVGQEGAQREQILLNIADKYGMRLIGPNCVGNINLYNGLNTTFIKGVPARGGIGFVSQSGAVCGAIVDKTMESGVGFSHLISLGNEVDVNETDIIAYLADDANTTIIAAYIESINNGSYFLETCKKITPKKPIVILKAGQSEEGAKAVSSHTGSMAGTMASYRAAFRQCGVIEAKNLQELIDIACALDFLPLPKGNQVCLITNAGGPAALVSDSIADCGLRLAALDMQTQNELKKMLNPAAQVDNPIDMLGGANEQDYSFALEVALDDPGVDTTVSILVPQALVNPLEVAKGIHSVQKEKNKPVIGCFVGESSIKEARAYLLSQRIPLIESPERIGPVIAALANYKNLKDKKSENTVPFSNLDMAKANTIINNLKKKKYVGEKETRTLLDAYGIPLVKGYFADNPEKAIQISIGMGFPVVLKIVSEQVLHKSDVGGIFINLRTEDDVRKGYDEIRDNLNKYSPSAKLLGVMVEKMAAANQEFIIGMKRDATFGPLILFGLGGIYVELIKDTSCRIAPLSLTDVKEMIEETMASRLISGYRGNPPLDYDAVVDVIFRINQIAINHPNIAELEINPFILYQQGEGGLAIDCRMIMAEE